MSSTSSMMVDAERVNGYIVKLASNAKLAYNKILHQFIFATGNKRIVYMDDKFGVLSTLSNIGANMPYEHGNLFAWVETPSKVSYTRENY